MDAAIEKYILNQPQDRQNILQSIHKIIIKEDVSVLPEVGKMMGKEMIIYAAKGVMKYALSSVKNYMSLHVMPVYGSPLLFEKYRALLPKASFQKGCINFSTGKQVPLKVIRTLIADCSVIDLAKIREKYLEQRRKKQN